MRYTTLTTDNGNLVVIKDMDWATNEDYSVTVKGELVETVEVNRQIDVNEFVCMMDDSISDHILKDIDLIKRGVDPARTASRELFSNLSLRHKWYSKIGNFFVKLFTLGRYSFRAGKSVFPAGIYATGKEVPIEIVTTKQQFENRKQHYKLQEIDNMIVIYDRTKR